MTHAYSTDSTERRYIPFFIAAAAIGVEFLIIHFFGQYLMKLPWWASPPIDTMASYGFLYWLFDSYIWEWPLMHKLHIIKTPNLSGVWRGHACTTVTNGASPGLGSQTDIEFTIKQTWTHMLICGKTTQSKSRSISASIIVTDECSLSYEYTNEPLAGAPDTMHAHRGTTILSIEKMGSVLKGEYYSGRDRQNVGTLNLTRV